MKDGMAEKLGKELRKGLAPKTPLQRWCVTEIKLLTRRVERLEKGMRVLALLNQRVKVGFDNVLFAGTEKAPLTGKGIIPLAGDTVFRDNAEG